jgi:hypothetical protein
LYPEKRAILKKNGGEIITMEKDGKAIMHFGKNRMYFNSGDVFFWSIIFWVAFWIVAIPATLLASFFFGILQAILF